MKNTKLPVELPKLPKMKIKYPTREQWLKAAMRAMVLRFKDAKVPKFSLKTRVSCGFSAKNNRKTLGTHWDPKSSGDKVSQIFISPVVDHPIRVLDILIHELVHAAIGNAEQHGPKFVKAIRALKLQGRPTHTEASPELAQELIAVVKSLGRYPHSALSPSYGRKAVELIPFECPLSGVKFMADRRDRVCLEAGAGGRVIWATAESLANGEIDSLNGIKLSVKRTGKWRLKK